MAPTGGRSRFRIAPAACLTLVAQLALSTPFVPGAENRETSTKPSVTMPAPIPLAALDKMPQDATAYCGDGTWSNAGTKQEACTSQGGIRAWFGPAPPGTTGRCKDGTYTRARKGTYGACLGQGGVKTWFSQTTPAAPRTD